MFKYGQAWTSNLSKPENRHDLLLKYYLQEIGTYGMQAIHQNMFIIFLTLLILSSALKNKWKAKKNSLKQRSIKRLLALCNMNANRALDLSAIFVITPCFPHHTDCSCWSFPKHRLLRFLFVPCQNYSRRLFLLSLIFSPSQLLTAPKVLLDVFGTRGLHSHTDHLQVRH